LCEAAIMKRILLVADDVQILDALRMRLSRVERKLTKTLVDSESRESGTVRS
jgi:hypothetical protein